MAPQQRERNQVLRAFTTVLSRSAAQARARFCVSMFSSASFVLLFTYSIQSSRLSSWLVAFFLHRRRMKICCLGRIHFVC